MTQMHSFQTMTLFTQECCSTCLVMTHFAKRNLVSLVFPFSCQEIKTLKKKIRKRVFAMKKINNEGCSQKYHVMNKAEICTRQ